MRGIMRPAATVRRPRSGRPWATGAASPRCAARAPGPGLTHRRCQCGHVLAAAQRGAFSGGAPVGEAFLGGSVAYLSAPGTAGEFAGPVPSGDARKVSRFRPELTSTGWTTDIGPLYRVRAWKMNVPAAAPPPEQPQRLPDQVQRQPPALVPLQRPDARRMLGDQGDRTGERGGQRERHSHYHVPDLVPRTASGRQTPFDGGRLAAPGRA